LYVYRVCVFDFDDCIYLNIVNVSVERQYFFGEKKTVIDLSEYVAVLS